MLDGLLFEASADDVRHWFDDAYRPIPSDGEVLSWMAARVCAAARSEGHQYSLSNGKWSVRFYARVSDRRFVLGDDVVDVDGVRAFIAEGADVVRVFSV